MVLTGVDTRIMAIRAIVMAVTARATVDMVLDMADMDHTVTAAMDTVDTVMAVMDRIATVISVMDPAGTHTAGITMAIRAVAGRVTAVDCWYDAL